MSVLVTGGLGFIGANVVLQLLKRDISVIVADLENEKNKLLQFHTDFRSPKVGILKKNKNASLVFYDKEEKIQLRIKVECF